MTDDTKKKPKKRDDKTRERPKVIREDRRPPRSAPSGPASGAGAPRGDAPRAPREGFAERPPRPAPQAGPGAPPRDRDAFRPRRDDDRRPPAGREGGFGPRERDDRRPSGGQPFGGPPPRGPAPSGQPGQGGFGPREREDRRPHPGDSRGGDFQGPPRGQGGFGPRDREDRRPSGDFRGAPGGAPGGQRGFGSSDRRPPPPRDDRRPEGPRSRPREPSREGGFDSPRPRADSAPVSDPASLARPKLRRIVGALTPPVEDGPPTQRKSRFDALTTAGDQPATPVEAHVLEAEDVTPAPTRAPIGSSSPEPADETPEGHPHEHGASAHEHVAPEAEHVHVYVHAHEHGHGHDHGHDHEHVDAAHPHVHPHEHPHAHPREPEPLLEPAAPTSSESRGPSPVAALVEETLGSVPPAPVESVPIVATSTFLEDAVLLVGAAPVSPVSAEVPASVPAPAPSPIGHEHPHSHPHGHEHDHEHDHPHPPVARAERKLARDELPLGAGRGKVLFLDAPSGLAGDMIVAALVDLGVPESVVVDAVAKLGLTGYELEFGGREQSGIVATKFDVRVRTAQPERTFRAVRAILLDSELPQRVKDRALLIFERLGRAEAKVHRMPIDEVHFHEVGAVDALCDVVGAAAALEYVGAEVVVSPLPMGRGFVKARHGTLPLPAPATVECLSGLPTYDAGIEGELVTPTGAAIVGASASRASRWPNIRTERVGWGAGTRSLPDRPNVLRAVLGASSSEPNVVAATGTHCVLEANLDDATGEIVGHCIETLIREGALDAWATPTTTKKGRPGLILGCLVQAALADRIVAALLRESTTIGVRRTDVSRVARPRREIVVQTAYGPISIKVSEGPFGTPQHKPEFDECARAATLHRVPVREVLATALAAARAVLE